MKFFNVGEVSDLKVELKISNQRSKFGQMYYFEKIQLTSTNPIPDYNVWESKEGQHYLCIRHEPSIRDDIVKIIDAVKMNDGKLLFKEIDSNVF